MSVAITGIGVVSAIGSGRAEFWEALCAGRSGIRAIDDSLAMERPPCLAAPVSRTALPSVDPRPNFRRMDSVSALLVHAALGAVADSGMDMHAVAPDRLGIVVGSAFGNVTESAGHIRKLFEKGPAMVSPLRFPNLVLNAPCSYASMLFDARGPSLTVSALEVSGECALIVGSDLIRAGRADVVMSGGVDELSALTIRAYRAAGALSSQQGGEEWSSPFDRLCNGVVLGEGAAMLMLESSERAKARGAHVYAYLEHDVLFSVPAPLYGWPHSIPDRERLASLVKLMSDESIGLVCGSANSSCTTDAFEISLLTEVLGARAARTWLTSLKGAVGEFGGCGALSVAAAALALQEQAIPPLCNLKEPHPASGFRHAAGRAVRDDVEHAVVFGSARGGAGAALLLKRTF